MQCGVLMINVRLTGPIPLEGRRCHNVSNGDPDLQRTVYAEAHFEPVAAGGGAESAANRIFSAIAAMCEA